MNVADLKSEVEKEIDVIVNKRWDEMSSNTLAIDKTTLKLAVLDGFGAGLDAAREIYKD